MQEIDFTDDDIDSLGRKLSDLNLQGTEKALMNAVLALAANTMRNVEPSGGEFGRSTIVSDQDIDEVPDPGMLLRPAMTPQIPDFDLPFVALIVKGTPPPIPPWPPR